MGVLSFFAFMISGFFTFRTTKFFFPKLYTDDTFLAVPTRLLLGVALIVCAMNLLLYLFPGQSAAWIIFIALMLINLLKPDLFFPRKNIRTLQNQNNLIILLISIFIIIWRLFSLVSIGYLTPFEGTGNHDELWYIFIADWLSEHTLNEPPPHEDPSFPFFSSAYSSLHLLPRIGSESLITFLSGISGIPIAQVYPIIFSIGTVLLMYATGLGLLVIKKWRRLEWALALCVIAISPVTLFIYGNGNLATCFGLIFLGSYYWFLYQTLSAAEDSISTIPTGIFLGALIATYPELLIIAIPASAIVLLQSLFTKKITWQKGIKRTLGIVLIAVVVAPMAILSSVRVFSTVSAAASAVEASPMFGDIFDIISTSNLILILFTLDLQSISQLVGHFAVTFASACLLAILLFVPKSFWIACAGLLGASLLVFIKMWSDNYGYGGMKAIQFFSLPINLLLGVGITYGLFKTQKSFWPLIIAALSLSILIFVSATRTLNFNEVARSKNLSLELIDLKQTAQILQPNHVLYISEDLGPHSFLASRWIAYLLRDTPMVYDPSLQGDAYIYNLKNQFHERLRQVTHILRRKQNQSANTHVEYEIVPADHALLLSYGPGFHGREGRWRWLEAKASLTIQKTPAPGTLVLPFLGHFEFATGNPTVEIKTPDGIYIETLTKGEGMISVPVTQVPVQIEIISGLQGVSPLEIGLSNDPRELTFRMEDPYFITNDKIKIK